MALASIPPTVRPRWPTSALDPARCWFDFDAVADELVFYFGGRPVPAVSDLIETSDGAAPAVLLGLDPDGEETGEIVGIHVYPLLAAAQARPAWRALAEPDPPAEFVARFVAEVKDLFERYWTPAPPIEEQPVWSRRADRGEGVGT